MLEGVQDILQELSVLRVTSQKLYQTHSHLIASFLTEHDVVSFTQIPTVYGTDELTLNSIRNLRLYELTIKGPLTIYNEVCQQLQEQFEKPREEDEQIKFLEECQRIVEEINVTFEKLTAYQLDLVVLSNHLKQKIRLPSPIPGGGTKEDDSWETLVIGLESINFESILSDQGEDDPFADFSDDDGANSLILQYESMPVRPYLDTPTSTTLTSVARETDLYRL